MQSQRQGLDLARSRSNILINSCLDLLKLIKNWWFSIYLISIRKYPLLKCNYIDLDFSIFEKKRDLYLSTSTIIECKNKQTKKTQRTCIHEMHVLHRSVDRNMCSCNLSYPIATFHDQNIVSNLVCQRQINEKTQTKPNKVKLLWKRLGVPLLCFMSQLLQIPIRMKPKCSFSQCVCDCDWINNNGCRRYLSHKMGTGPIDCNWICQHPLSQLAHHSRIKGHFVMIFDTVGSRSRFVWTSTNNQTIKPRPHSCNHCKKTRTLSMEGKPIPQSTILDHKQYLPTHSIVPDWDSTCPS